jgi:hypothetical protein
VAFVVLGWGLAMDRYLVFGSITIDNAGARPQVLGPLLWVLAIGGFALLPALYALFRVFKSTGR